MKLTTAFAMTAAITATLGSTAFAQDYKGRVSAGVSTFGATVEGAYRFHPNIGVRGMAAGLIELSPDVTFDGTSYATTLGADDLAFGAMIDLYPLQNIGLRLSGGVIRGNVKATGTSTATAANPIDVGGAVLSNNELVTAGVEFANEVSPMVSIGYEQPLFNSAWVLSGEVGALFNGGYNTSVSVTGGVANLAPAQIQAEVDRIKNDIPDIQVYPYVSIMLGMRF